MRIKIISLAVRVPKDDLFFVCLFCLFVLQRVPCFIEIWGSQSLVESILSPLSWNLMSTEVESVLFLCSVLSRCSHLMISRGWRELSTTREKWLCFSCQTDPCRTGSSIFPPGTGQTFEEKELCLCSEDCAKHPDCTWRSSGEGEGGQASNHPVCFLHDYHLMKISACFVH